MIDTLKSVSLPEGAEITLRLAGPLPRALAWLSDTLLRIGIMMLMSMLLAWFGRAGQGFFMIGFFTLWELYPILFEALWDGATPGKRMMKIAVVNGDGTPLAWRAAILRNVLRFADMLPFGYAAGLTS
ncbi:MAG TPA: RDD family protein, partial [Usitatibacter sp.]|nr:RDD family protein [Usitatibacter sp.]